MAPACTLDRYTTAARDNELMIPKKELAAAKQNYCILSSQGHLSDTKIRVLADRVPAVGCPVSCTPTVCDGYMELLRLLEKGAKI